jgi:ATP-dependent helicase/nuclease subunit A
MNPHPAIIPHEAILASAGSGKTFRLAHRFIRLLAHDVEPNRIIAITFSRKAAGEIFTAIVTHLQAAAADPQEAAATAARIECPHLTTADFLVLLRRFLNELQHLHISTIDSFTIGLLRAFPMELGLSPTFDVMNNDSTEALQARTQALDRLFQVAIRHPLEQQALLQAFKQATFGRETKSFAREFDTFIANHHSQFKQLPTPRTWGDTQRIWPAGCRWLAPATDPSNSLQQLRQHAIEGDWKDFARKKWLEFLDAMETWHPSLSKSPIDYLGDRLLANATELENGRITLDINRTSYTRTGPPTAWMLTIVHHMMHQYLTHALEVTRGIYQLLSRFENVYDELIRRPGLITFDDAPYLILRNGRQPSRQAHDAQLLHIDYRLDSQLDHWLIDEFQDTSDPQWAVLSNLADEVLQDTQGNRSFFFVGDVKQAVYGWRGGNHKLFGQILSHYGSRIQQIPLNMSFRSAPAVLEVVNSAFADLPTDADQIPPATAAQWADYWGTHIPRNDQTPPTGYAALIEAGEASNDQLATYQACADLLHDINPLARGIKVAILVRKNDTAREIANHLRNAHPEMPVTVEGDAQVADNPVVLLLLALVQYAAHPGDSLAREQLRMSPIGDSLFSSRLSPTDLLRDIYRNGYQSFLDSWIKRLDAAHPLDAFGHQRGAAMLDAAAAFDAAGQRDPGKFIALMRAHRFQGQTAESTIRIMTVHKSKGLGFDMVIVPDLAFGNSLRSRNGSDIHIAQTPAGQPHWALRMPVKAAAAQDPVLDQEAEQLTVDHCFENLCGLYVALTRAKRGLYLITTPPTKTKTNTLHAAAFLRLQLIGDPRAQPATHRSVNGTSYGWLHESGQPNWYMEQPEAPAPAPATRATIPPHFPRKKSKRRRLLKGSPSSRAEGARAAHLLFTPSVHRSLELGTAVHGLFEQVNWIDDSPAEEVIARWHTRMLAKDEEAEKHFQTAYLAPAFQHALARPSGPVTLWREKTFEAVIEDEWITGTFDRVVLVHDTAGNVINADILDYKTNDVSPDNLADTVDHYRPQLALYAQALSLLTAIPPDRITCHLLFTRTGQVIRVDMAKT